MIVRILGEGQFRVDDELLDRLNVLDQVVEKAVAASDAEALAPALAALLDAVREGGVELEADLLLESDLILPDSDADLQQLRAWLEGPDSPNGEGLIPG